MCVCGWGREGERRERHGGVGVGEREERREGGKGRRGEREERREGRWVGEGASGGEGGVEEVFYCRVGVGREGGGEGYEAVGARHNEIERDGRRGEGRGGYRVRGGGGRDWMMAQGYNKT